MQICDKKSCTGCSACYNICPKKCITMVEDKNGVTIPNTDLEKCIHCNMCVKTCPENNKIEYNEPIKVYAAWSLDDKTRKNSSSGGIASEIYKYIIQNNGIAVGTRFNKEMKLEHKIATNIEEIKEFVGSKYVQSFVGRVFKEIKQYLLNNKTVVFVGTPCQVSGLKNFLKNVNTRNLFLIDLVCHGVPPIKYLDDYLKYLKINKNIDNITFRGKNNWNFTAYNKGKVIYKKHNKEDLYYKAFLKSLFYRENCYNCKYARKERVSDITLGDFWGIGKQEKFDYPIEDGVSLIMINTKKGNDLIGKIKHNLFIKERTIEEAMEGNEQLNHPSIKNKETDEFRRMYREFGFDVAIENIMKEMKNI